MIYWTRRPLFRDSKPSKPKNQKWANHFSLNILYLISKPLNLRQHFKLCPVNSAVQVNRFVSHLKQKTAFFSEQSIQQRSECLF